MNTRTILFTLAFCLAGALAAFASDPNLGSWKLNEAKSSVPAGAAKNTSVTYTVEGDSFKCVVEGVDGEGNPTHNEWTGKFDGKGYPLTGDPTSDTRAIKKLDPRHYKLTQWKQGQVTSMGTIELSADGKTRTVTVEATGADGKKHSATFAYDKQ